MRWRWPWRAKRDAATATPNVELQRAAALRRAWTAQAQRLAELARPAEALAALSRAHRSEPDHAGVLYEVAKLLRASGHIAPARRFARRALERGLAGAPIRGLLALLAFTSRDYEDCLAHLATVDPLPQNLENLGARARVAREVVSAPDGGAKVRHIAIGGHSYIGSTLLGALLGSVPGCGHAGETGELTERRAHREGASAAPFATWCRACGENCEAFTIAFRESLPSDGRGFYQAVGRRLGVSTLITSDKFVTDFLTRDPALDFDLIILYKPLASWLRSYVRRKMPAAASPSERRALIETWLDHWTMTYESLLGDFRPTGRVIALNWEAVVDRPHAHIGRLLRLLDLEGEPAQLFDHVIPGHYVGGNTTQSVLRVLKSGRMDFRHSDAPALAPDEEALVEAHARANLVYRRLQRRYRQDFLAI